jgi:hypothetical protein
MNDAIDLSTVTFVNSPDVKSWPITSELTALRLGGGKMHIDHTKRGQWPPVPFETTTQEATVWVFFNIGGQWFGTGGERLRPNQNEKDLGKPSDIGPGWLYAADRWKQMTNYVPKTGELVGFMVAAGISRGFGAAPVQERTAVVLIPFPSDAAGGSYPPFHSVSTTPPVMPDPGPGPVKPDPPVQNTDVASLAARLDRIEAALNALAARPAPAYSGTFADDKTISLKPVK